MRNNVSETRLETIGESLGSPVLKFTDPSGGVSSEFRVGRTRVQTVLGLSGYVHGQESGDVSRPTSGTVLIRPSVRERKGPSAHTSFRQIVRCGTSVATAELSPSLRA